MATTVTITTGTSWAGAATDGSNILVTCIGAGGGACAGGGSSGQTVGGGGGGELARSSVAYTPGATVSGIQIGAGVAGNNGTETHWNTNVIIAKGGSGALTIGAKGAGGTGGTGTYLSAGGEGGSPSSYAGGGGGASGCLGYGGNGSNASGNTGGDGGVISGESVNSGSGGRGGDRYYSGNNGGNYGGGAGGQGQGGGNTTTGANGIITITYNPTSAPIVTTQIVTDITTSTATGNGNVTLEGGASITERGICWSTSPTPTTANNKATAAGTTGALTASITGLSALTKYYARAYAINANGTGYGEEVEFAGGLLAGTPYRVRTFVVTPAGVNYGDTIQVNTLSDAAGASFLLLMV